MNLNLFDWYANLWIPKPPAGSVVAAPADLEARRSALLVAHNAQRAMIWLAPLGRVVALDAAAQKHAEDMARTGWLSHTGSDGSNYQTRMSREGYRAGWTGENIIYGGPDVNTIMLEWLRSRTHRANILNRHYNQVGFGVAVSGNGYTYWCANFGG